jgi:hypothetical protein
MKLVLRRTHPLVALRAKRDRLLQATDAMALPDYPLTAEARDELRRYRQALRDWPEHPDAPEPALPELAPPGPRLSVRQLLDVFTPAERARILEFARDAAPAIYEALYRATAAQLIALDDPIMGSTRHLLGQSGLLTEERLREVAAAWEAVAI